MRACRYLRSDRLLLFELHTFFLSFHRISLDTTCYMYLRPYSLMPVLLTNAAVSLERDGIFFSRTPHVRPVPSVRSNGKYTDRWILILIYTPSIGSYSLFLFFAHALTHSKSLPNPTLPIPHTHTLRFKHAITPTAHPSLLRFQAQHHHHYY